jgi:ketosteroid isomerase-like protein
MSQERVGQVLRAYDAMNRGDVESAFAGLSPDFEFIPPGILPDVEVHRGRDAAVRFWNTWTEAFDDLRFAIEETIDAGEQVVVMAAVCGAVKGAGTEVRTPTFPFIWTFEGDQIVRMEAMQNRALALEAVGLGDEPAG